MSRSGFVVHATEIIRKSGRLNVRGLIGRTQRRVNCRMNLQGLQVLDGIHTKVIGVFTHVTTCGDAAF
jgi:hypothetical protein